MTGDDIRQRFLDYFAGRDHLVLPSATLQPDDPTTYFTSAGMQPFVPYFLGNEEPPGRRVATCQKCLRADDLDEVGYTSRHLSFFEMLGNFSFGDYFKAEAIAWGWEFVREGLELDAADLWVSVYADDDEAADLWRRHVEPERIVRFGIDDNWWGPVGNSGPCGPCSEIFLDRGPAWGDAPTPVEDEGGDRYVELWNLVFQQYNSPVSKAELKRTGQVPPPLPAPGIDTGAGLERIAAALQGVSTVFESDLLSPLCDAVKDLTQGVGDDPETLAAVRRIADHARAVTFAIADGIFPSNKAGGYVVRQILRRAARFGRLRLGLAEPFLHRLIPAVVDRYAATYPEIREAADSATAIVRQEEERFAEALDAGIPRLEEQLERLQQRGDSLLGGDEAFALYDTYGVPIEVQVEIAREHALSVDVDGFEAARASRERKAISEVSSHGEFAGDRLREVEPTTFLGYDATEATARVTALVVEPRMDTARGLLVDGERPDQVEAGTEATLVLDRTPFYAESGGQVGDVGTLSVNGATAEVLDTQKDKNGRWLHRVRVTEGELAVGQTVQATVDVARRDAIRRAHTATHLVHAALRRHLGRHVAQAGSLVEADRLRFDFSHGSGLTHDQLRAIEHEVNVEVLRNHRLGIQEMALDQARRHGALMFFGEKYGQQVRVVDVGEADERVSAELCGGTHVERTGDIGQVRLVAESSIGSGIRRLEALTGLAALAHAHAQEARLAEVAAALKAPAAEAAARVEQLQQHVRELERALAQRQQATVGETVAQLAEAAEAVDGVPVVATTLQGVDAASLKALADDLVERLQDGVALLGAALDGKVLVVCKAADAAVERGVHAGNVVRAAAQAAGGGGGGRPNFAQAGGRDPNKLADALAAGRAVLAEQLGGV